MKDNIKLFVTVALALTIALAIGVSLIGFAQAQDSGDTSITGSYDYSNEELDYTIDGNPFTDPYNSRHLERNNTYDDTSGDYPGMGQYTFQQNGSYMYPTFGDILEYHTLDNDYEVSSRNFQNSMQPLDGTFAEGGLITGLVWSDNGNKFTVLGTEGLIGMLVQYEVDTPYSLSGSPQQVGSYQLIDDRLYGLEWVDNGNTILTYDAETQEVWAVDCANAYNITDCTDEQYETSGNPQTVRGFDVNSDASEAYLTTRDSDTILEYDFDNNYRLSNQEEIQLDNQFEWFQWSENGRILVTEQSDTATQSSAAIGYSIPKGTIDTWLVDSNGEEISETRSETDTATGSIQYNTSTYQQVSVNYQNNVIEELNAQSDPISIYGDGEISIREEQTNNLITDPVNVTAYGGESGIYSLDTTDGTIDITNLPDQSYTFAVSSNSYYQRVRYIDSLGNADNLYLLDNSTDVVTSQFSLEDRTGTYDQDSRLVIRRSISGNGNNWETIISDSFGSEGLTVDLEQNVRYRLYVGSDTQTQLIGPYRASISETVTVSPSSGEIDVNQGDYWSAGAQYNNQEVDVRFVDPTGETDSVSVTIYQRGNESNVLVSNDEYINPSELMLEYPVSNQYNDSNWLVELTVTRGSETYTTSFNVGPTANIVPTELDDFWRKLFAVLLMLCFGLVFSALNKAVGSIIYACIGGLFYWIGLLEGLTTAGLIVAYFFIVIVYNIYMKT